MSANNYYNNQASHDSNQYYAAEGTDNQLPQGEGERGIGTWVGAAAGGLIGHHEGKHFGHGTMGTVGGAAVGVLAGKLVEELMEGKQHNQGGYHNSGNNNHHRHNHHNHH
jgi:outer membrane lipoprotein SlyB